MEYYSTGIMDETVSGYGDFESLREDILEKMPAHKEMWAEKINQIFADSGLTVAAFAELCGVKPPMVRKWRDGAVPQNRETFIRIGFAAGYDLDQMNGFLKRYGRCHQLYVKDLEDTACIFVLQSQTLPHDYKTCQMLRQHLEEMLREPAEQEQPVYSTEKMMDAISHVSTETELLRYVRENAASYKEAHDKFYSFIQFYLDANRAYMEYDEQKKCLVTKYIPIRDLEIEQNWSSSLQKCVSAILSRKWPLRRNKVLSLGLHLNMTRNMFDQMLEYAHMEGLYPKNPAEAILIYALEEYQLDAPDERVVQDGSSELRDKVREYLQQAGLKDAVFLEKEL